MANKFHTERILQNLGKIRDTLPPLLANQAQNFFVDSFRKQAWRDGNTQNWKEVQRRTPGTYAYKYPKSKGLSRQSSPILVRTGKLKRAVNNSIRQARFEKIELVVGLPYARVHNEGNVKRGIPKRQYMGDSQTLRSMQAKLIINKIDKVWQT